MRDFQEVITNSIGEMGVAQLIMVFGVRAGLIVGSWTMIMMSFAGATPDWWLVHQNKTGTFSRFNQIYI